MLPLDDFMGGSPASGPVKRKKKNRIKNLFSRKSPTIKFLGHQEDMSPILQARGGDLPPAMPPARKKGHSFSDKKKSKRKKKKRRSKKPAGGNPRDSSSSSSDSEVSSSSSSSEDSGSDSTQPRKTKKREGDKGWESWKKAPFDQSSSTGFQYRTTDTSSPQGRGPNTSTVKPRLHTMDFGSALEPIAQKDRTNAFRIKTLKERGRYAFGQLEEPKENTRYKNMRVTGFEGGQIYNGGNALSSPEQSRGLLSRFKQLPTFGRKKKRGFVLPNSDDGERLQGGAFAGLPIKEVNPFADVPKDADQGKEELVCCASSADESSSSSTE